MCAMVASVAAAMSVIVQGYCGKTIVVAKNIIFENSKLEIEDIKKFPLDAAHIALSKDARAKRPVDVLESGVVEILIISENDQHCWSENRQTTIATLLASITAPRKTRSYAHSSRAMCKCGLARST